MSIVKYDYNGFEIEFEEINGVLMANATAMCKAFDRKPNDWLRLDSAQRYIDALAKRGNPALVDIRKGGSNSGTWINEKLILKLAQWLSVDFEVWCDERLAELIRTGRVEIKPMTTEELIIAQAQSVMQVKKELAEVKQEVKELASKMLTSPTDYFTIAGYASLQGMKIDVPTASKIGKKVSSICTANGYPTGTVPDARFGKVKTYPKEALEAVFNELS